MIGIDVNWIWIWNKKEMVDVIWQLDGWFQRKNCKATSDGTFVIAFGNWWNAHFYKERLWQGFVRGLRSFLFFSLKGIVNMFCFLQIPQLSSSNMCEKHLKDTSKWLILSLFRPDIRNYLTDFTHLRTSPRTGLKMLEENLHRIALIVTCTQLKAKILNNLNKFVWLKYLLQLF